WNGVTFEEKNPTGGPVSPRLTFTPAKESRLQMQGWFGWDDLVTQAASKAFVGYARVVSTYTPTTAGLPRGFDGANPYFSYVNPLAHPDWPNGFYLCEGFEMQGFTPLSPAAGTSGTNAYKEAAGTLYFKSVQNGYHVLPDDWVASIVGDRT